MSSSVDLHVTQPPGLRPVSDHDADGLVRLVRAAYAEYPGCVLDLADLDADLLTPAQVAAPDGRRWWVVEDGGEVVASVAAAPGSTDPALTELKRLYVAASHRRRGLGAALVAVVDGFARDESSAGIELWSDTRFAEAHRLYERLGFAATGEQRRLHDPSDTTEYRFLRLYAIS